MERNTSETIDLVERLSHVLIDGVLVPEFCLEHNIPFKQITKGFIRQRSIKRLDRYSDEELVIPLIENALKHIVGRPDQIVYMIDGMTVKEFCMKYHLITQCLRSYLKIELDKNPNADVSELAHKFVQKSHDRALYNSKLSSLCRSRNIPMKDVLTIYHEEYEGKVDIPRDEALFIILDDLYLISKRDKKLEYKSKNSNTGKIAV